ncbi:hypothetical protein quinque_010604 [Culex quinquefasciatus]
MSRIPPKARGPPLLLLSGFFGSSVDFTVQGPNRSLAFLAHSCGFDVWMGNNRGTTFSKRHRSLSVDSKRFWRFSFHELGLYDLAAMVDYVLGVTGSDRVQFVGLSQAAATFLALSSLRPEYNEREISHNLKGYELLGRGFDGSPMDAVAIAVKSRLIPVEMVLKGVWTLLGYHDSIERSLVPEIMQYTPAGASIFQVINFMQIFKAKRFQQYDFGAVKNLQRYNCSIPPEYPLDRVTAPVHIYHSSFDNLNQPGDVEELIRRLPNVVQKYQVQEWNHLDFFYGSEAHVLYKVILSTIKKS